MGYYDGIKNLEYWLKKPRNLEVGTIFTVLLPYILYIIIHKILYSTAFSRAQMIKSINQ